MPNLTFQQIADKTGRKLETAFHEYTQDLAEEVVRRTRVDTGFLRGSWFAAVNSRSGPDGEADPTGGTTITSIALNIRQAEPGDLIVIGNNAEYAAAQEYGTAGMEPRAMVRSTVRDASAIAERTIQRIAR